MFLRTALRLMASGRIQLIRKPSVLILGRLLGLLDTSSIPLHLPSFVSRMRLGKHDTLSWIQVLGRSLHRALRCNSCFHSDHTLPSWFHSSRNRTSNVHLGLVCSCRYLHQGLYRIIPSTIGHTRTDGPNAKNGMPRSCRCCANRVISTSKSITGWSSSLSTSLISCPYLADSEHQTD